MAIKTSRAVRKQNPLPRRKKKSAAKLPIEIDPNTNAAPFEVTTFAARVFPPPAISDAVEEEAVFDKSKAKSKAKRVHRTKKKPAKG